MIEAGVGVGVAMIVNKEALIGALIVTTGAGVGAGVAIGEGEGGVGGVGPLEGEGVTSKGQ
jgi:hypothetical protein